MIRIKEALAIILFISIVITASLFISEEHSRIKFLEDQNRKIEHDSSEGISRLESKISDINKELIRNRDIASVVSEWSPQVAIVSCLFMSGKNETTLSTGSGFLTNLTDKSPSVITNKHIMVYQKGEELLSPWSCSVDFQNGDRYFYLWSSGNMFYSKKWDKAIINLVDMRPSTGKLIKRDDGFFCSTRGEIGDRIVVIGYPSIGSRTGVTATDGIISGYDGDYYVVSAKMDKGSSGGIAVSVYNNCIIGIPTLVVEGGSETLGRILSSEIIIKSN